MKFKLQNIKDPITDIIGLVIICITLYEIYAQDWAWLWEGLTGVGVGLCLFMFPDDWLKDTLTATRDKLLNKKPEE